MKTKILGETRTAIILRIILRIGVYCVLLLIIDFCLSDIGKNIIFRESNIND